MARTPESLVKNKLRDLLKRLNVWFFFPAAGSFGRAGVPDVIGIHKGRGFGIECKAGKGKATALQLRELARIKEAGGFALILNETEGWEVLLDFLSNG